MKNYNLKSLAVITLLSSINYAFADNAVLENEFIRAGVNEFTGTLGSGGNTPPGLLYDVTGLGVFDNDYDYLTPGSPYEGWAVRIDDAYGLQLQLYGNNNAGGSNSGNQSVVGAWVGMQTASSAIWAGSTPEFTILHTYTLPSGRNYLDIATRLEITSISPIENLYFARYIDPDAGAYLHGYDTDNARGYSTIPTTNAVFTEANVTRYALGLYTSQIGNVNASIQPGWSSDPKDYYDNVGDPYSNCTFTCHGDYVMGIAFYSSNLSMGDILNYNYAYIFGPTSFAAAQDVVDGGGGGGDPGISSFGVLIDVGDASALTPPTLVSTSESPITISDTSVASATLPVITASVAHHTASETHGIQTIARETTTNVTTPMERTLVTKVRTTSIWSDGSESNVDSSPTTDVTISNSVVTTFTNDNFSGRIDQQSQLSDLNKGINRRLNADAFRKDMVDGERYRMYMGATYLSSKADNGYDANSNRFNIGVEADVDVDVDVGWIAGIQYNNVTTKLDGVDSFTKQNKNHAGFYNVITMNDWIIKSDFGVADNNIKSNRNVEQTFFNASKTNGTDVWLSNRAYMPSINGLRPYAEFTFGNNERNAYIETGSVQSYRSVSKVNDSINFGEFGVRYDKTIDKLNLTGEAGVSTDSYKDLKAELSYLVNPTSRLSWSYSRQEHKDLVSNSVALYGKINF